MGLADGIAGGQLMSVTVVAVFKGGDSVADAMDAMERFSRPLAIAGVELSPLLVRNGAEAMGLADGIAGGQLMSVTVVAVFKGGDSVADAISVRSIGAPFPNMVAMGSVDSAVAGGRPCAEAASRELLVEGFS